MRTKNQNSIVKNKQIVCSKDLNFEFLAVVDDFKLEKNANFLFPY